MHGLREVSSTFVPQASGGLEALRMVSEPL